MKALPPTPAGTRFGCWTTVEAGVREVPCRCDCGTEKQVRTASLRNGRSSSCGCTRYVLDARLDEIRRLYAEGRSQSEIAQAYGVKQSAVQQLMLRHGIEARPAGRPAGVTYPKRAHDAADYSTLHARVRRQRGTPSRCERCGTTDPAERYEWANLTGNYADADDYERMCRPCHGRFDSERRQAAKVAVPCP